MSEQSGTSDGSTRDDGTRDWVKWHEDYDNPASGLSWRLKTIQQHITAAVDRLPPGPFRAVSLCAGQGRDLIGALATHPRRPDLRARLVELDPVNAGYARTSAEEAGLSEVKVSTEDAGDTTVLDGAVPAELILLCGIFGNITDDDVNRTIEEVPHLAAPGATVFWTRHRNPPDLTPAIRTWFSESGFEELAFETHPSGVQGVGVHRLVAEPKPYRPGVKLFEFVTGRW